MSSDSPDAVSNIDIDNANKGGGVAEVVFPNLRNAIV